MRRISRTRGPSGLICISSRSVAPLSSQCGAAPFSPSTSSTATPTRRITPPNSFVRSYSDKPEFIPTAQAVKTELASLPRSLGAGDSPQEIIGEQEELSSEELAAQLEHAFKPLPPRAEAERPNDVSDPTYVPAMTMEGLPEPIGELEGWWDTREHWPASRDFEGFKARRKVLDSNVLELAAKRALVETLVLKAMGKNVVEGLPVGGREELLRAAEVEVHVSKAGEVSLNENSVALASDLDWKTWEEKVDESVATFTPNEAKAFQEKMKDHSWKDASLADSKLKFAVTKRIFQLTGRRIPDYRLAEISNMHTLLVVLLKPPKPKTFTKEIRQRQQKLLELPNVSFKGKRVTRGDKDKALGRYKLIEKEFAKREVDIHPASVGGSKELKWFKGDA